MAGNFSPRLSGRTLSFHIQKKKSVVHDTSRPEINKQSKHFLIRELRYYLTSEPVAAAALTATAADSEMPLQILANSVRTCGHHSNCRRLGNAPADFS